MPQNVYARLISLFTAEEGRAPYYTPQDNDYFNFFVQTKVLDRFGVGDWESLPENFDVAFYTQQPGNTLISSGGQSLFDQASSSAADFFAVVTAPPATPAGGGAPAAGPVPSGILSFFDNLLPGVFGAGSSPAAAATVTAPAATVAAPAGPAQVTQNFATPPAQTVAQPSSSPPATSTTPDAEPVPLDLTSISGGQPLTLNSFGALTGTPLSGPFVGPVAPAQTLGTAFPASSTGPKNTAADLLSNIFTGNNAPALTPSGGVIISSVTNAPQTTNLSYDQSSSSSVTYNSTVNQPELVKNLLEGVKGFFGTVQASPSSTPMNDSVFQYGAMYPGYNTAGQQLDPSRSVQGSLVAPVAKVTGDLGSTFSDPSLRRLALISVAIGLVGLFFIFRRAK